MNDLFYYVYRNGNVLLKRFGSLEAAKRYVKGYLKVMPDTYVEIWDFSSGYGRCVEYYN